MTRKGRVLAHVETNSTLFENIKNEWFEDNKLNNFREKMSQSEAKEAILYKEGVLRIRWSLCMFLL